MGAKITEADCIALDRQPNPLDAVAAGFAPGAPDTVYLDANSIGPMPLAAPVTTIHLFSAIRRPNSTAWM